MGAGAVVLTVLVAVFLVRAAAGQSLAAPTGLTLLSKDGRRAVPTIVAGDQELVALDDLASLFQLNVREEAGAITVSANGKTVVLTPDQALASVSGRLVSMSAPPARVNRRWYVPIDFIARALAPIADVKVDLRRASRLVVVGDLRVPRIAFRYDALPVPRLTIDATPRATSTVTQDAGHLAIRFDADALDLTPYPAVPAQGVVQGLRQLDPVTIGIDLGPRFGGFHATSQPADQAMRLVIDFVNAQPTDTNPPAPSAGVAPSSPSPPSPPGLPGSPAAPVAPSPTPPQPAAPELPAIGAPPVFRTITIDPGHGGDDEGARGAQGIKEKDVTLAVARRVRAIVEGRVGLRVLLTRDDDRPVALEDRTSVANNNKADLFISLHANASWRSATRGTTIYCASFDPSADASAKAATVVERLPAFGGGVRELDLVPWDLAQTRYVDRSLDFAHILEQQFHPPFALGPHGVDRAPLRVLESANMPAVLIELGYLSNPQQEQQLASPDYQAAVSQAIADAVIRYRDMVSGGGTR